MVRHGWFQFSFLEVVYNVSYKNMKFLYEMWLWKVQDLRINQTSSFLYHSKFWNMLRNFRQLENNFWISFIFASNHSIFEHTSTKMLTFTNKSAINQKHVKVGHKYAKKRKKGQSFSKVNTVWVCSSYRLFSGTNLGKFSSSGAVSFVFAPILPFWCELLAKFTILSNIFSFLSRQGTGFTGPLSGTVSALACNCKWRMMLVLTFVVYGHTAQWTSRL